MQRLALIACLVLVLAGIAGLMDLLVLKPYRASAERVTSLQLELEEVALRTDGARRRLAAASTVTPIDVAQLVTPGDDNDMALAALQDRVRRAVAAQGGQVLSTVGSITSSFDGLSRLVVGLNGRFEEASLFAFLRDLEGGTPPLVVESLTVRPLPVPGGLPLDVNVTLVSFGVRPNAP